MAGYKLDKTNPKPVIVAGSSIIVLLLLGGLFDLRMGRQEIPALDYLAFAISLPVLAAMIWGICISLLRIYREGVLQEVVQMTARTSSMIFIIMVGAALFTLIFLGFSGDYYITQFLTNLPGGRVGAFILVMLVMFILGFFLDFIQIVFVVVPIVAPVLFLMDINPIWLGVMMAMNLQTSFLTPPMAMSAYYLKGVQSKNVQLMEIFSGIMPFLGIVILAMVLMYIFPGIALWLPDTLFAQ